MEFNTKLLHGTAVKRYAEGATLPPIAQVNAFRYHTAEELDQVFHHRAAGYSYSRVANPTVTAFEQRISEMEGGNAAIACSSGMTAIMLSFLNFLCGGDEIIASAGLYGGSFDLFRDLEKLGITTKYVRHMTPVTAFPNVTGLETLGLRMKQICQNARKLAEALDQIPEIQVNYPLLPQSRYRDLALRQLNKMGGGILTFRAGSREKAFGIMNALHYAVKATSIGDVRTLVIHPASTLYIQSTKEQREAAGVYEDTVRVSMGIEDAEDLISDFVRAVNALR